MDQHLVKIYLLIIWYYIEIFCSKVADLKTIIKYASIVTTFLGIWHNWVIGTDGFSLNVNFLSRETYTDVALSCHFVVSSICYMRDNFSHLQRRLEYIGTDCVESFWNSNGQWVGTQQSYTFGHLQRNIGHQVRLDQIRVDPKRPTFAKPHPKGESIWHRQYDEGCLKADLQNYPAQGEEVNAWKEGIVEGRHLAMLVDMIPGQNQAGGNNQCLDDYPSDSGDCPQDLEWFFKTYNYKWNKFNGDDDSFDGGDSNGGESVSFESNQGKHLSFL